MTPAREEHTWNKTPWRRGHSESCKMDVMKKWSDLKSPIYLLRMTLTHASAATKHNLPITFFPVAEEISRLNTRWDKSEKPKIRLRKFLLSHFHIQPVNILWEGRVCKYYWAFVWLSPQSHFPGVRGWGAGGRQLKMEAWGLRLEWWGAEVGAIWGYQVQGYEPKEEEFYKE